MPIDLFLRRAAPSTLAQISRQGSTPNRLEGRRWLLAIPSASGGSCHRTSGQNDGEALACRKGADELRRYQFPHYSAFAGTQEAI